MRAAIQARGWSAQASRQSEGMDRVWSGPKHEQNVNIVYPYTMKKSVRTVYLANLDRFDYPVWPSFTTQVIQ